MEKREKVLNNLYQIALRLTKILLGMIGGKCGHCAVTGIVNMRMRKFLCARMRTKKDVLDFI